MRTNAKKGFWHIRGLALRFLAVSLPVALCLAALPVSLAAAAVPAGTVSALRGQVEAVGADGTARTLVLEDPVYSGDVISTGLNSMVRVHFTDRSIMFLRPSSTMAVHDYFYSGDPEQDRNAFSLVKGGFRAVAGAVGQASPDNYRIDTPVATIGIRGTDHEGRYCADDCYDLVDLGVPEPPNGLYTGTNSGRTFIGTMEFGPGQYGYTNPAGMTVRLPEAPPILRLDPFLRGAFRDLEPVRIDDLPVDDYPEDSEEPDDMAEEVSSAPEEDADWIDIPAQPSTVSAVSCS